MLVVAERGKANKKIRLICYFTVEWYFFRAKIWGPLLSGELGLVAQEEK